MDRHPASGVWRVRIEVPKDLRPIVGQTAFTKSLGTKDAHEARRRAPGIQAPILKLLAEARLVAGSSSELKASAGFTPDRVRSLIHEWKAANLGEMTMAFWERGRHASLSATFPEFGAGGPRGFDADFNAALFDALVASYVTPSELKLDPSFDEALLRLLRRIAGQSGILVPANDHPATGAALTLLRSAVQDLAKQQVSLRDGCWSLDQPLGSPTSSASFGTEVGSLGEASIAAFSKQSMRGAASICRLLEDHIAHVRPDAKVESGFRVAVRRLLAFLEVDDLPADDVTHRTVEDHVAFLRKLPKKMTPGEWASGLRVVVREFEAGLDHRPRLAPTSIAKDVNLLRAIWQRAVDRGRVQKQVFSGLTSKRDHKPRVIRQPFSEGQINRIFMAPIFTGCLSNTSWRDAGEHLVNDHRYWLPLIAVAMGLRMEEAAQLQANDVKHAHGIDYLDITEFRNEDEDGDATAGPNDTKAVKTRPSRRRLPLHPTLIRLGFLDYVLERRQAGDSRLFPTLTKGKNDRFGAKASQWFNRDFLSAIGIKSPSLRFHSFRHLFVDCVREAGVEERIAKALLGHAGGSAHDRYGNGHSLHRLNEAMKKVEVPGFPLDALIAARGRNGRSDAEIVA